MTEFKPGDYAMVRVGKTPTDSPDLAWLIFENGLLAGSVASTALSPLPPPATEAERRLVEAVLALLQSAGVHTANAMHRAAEAVLAERKPPDPVDPVEEVIAAWEEWESTDRGTERLRAAMEALAASRSDKT